MMTSQTAQSYGAHLDDDCKAQLAALDAIEQMVDEQRSKLMGESDTGGAPDADGVDHGPEVTGADDDNGKPGKGDAAVVTLDAKPADASAAPAASDDDGDEGDDGDLLSKVLKGLKK